MGGGASKGGAAAYEQAAEGEPAKAGFDGAPATAGQPPGGELQDEAAPDAPSAWSALPPGLPSREELLIAALEDKAQTTMVGSATMMGDAKYRAQTPIKLQRSQTPDTGHEVPPPPPVQERQAPNRRPQLRVRRLERDDEENIRPASPSMDLSRIRRTEMQRRSHAAKTAQGSAALQEAEIDANLIAGFQEAMDAAKKRMEISAIEQAELLGLLRVKEKQLQELASAPRQSAPPAAATAVDGLIVGGATEDDDSEDAADVFEAPSAQLARLKFWRKQVTRAVQPWTDRLGPARHKAGSAEDDARVLRGLDHAMRAAATAEVEQEGRLIAEARFLAARKQLEGAVDGALDGVMIEMDARPTTPSAAARPPPITDATLRTKLSDREVDIRRLQEQVRLLDEDRKVLRLEVSQLTTELSISSAASGRPGTAASAASKDSSVGAGVVMISTEAAMEARHNAERLGVVEAQIASLTPKYEAAVEDARAMRVEAERAIELDAMLKERTVQLCLMRNAKEQSLEEIHRLENAMEDLTPRRPEEPGYDGDKDKGFDNLSVDMTTHEKLLELEDSRAEVERSGSEAGMMVYSLQKKDAQIAALQDLYAAATAQAASARRQAEAATVLNEQLILARTAPHHDANQDAKILLTGLRHRAAEQDQFIVIIMKRMAILEHFILEEKALVVQRATEHVGNKLIESTRRFNVYARKAAEREEFLARQLADSRKETEASLVASNTLEEHRLFAEKSCEHETRRREQARRQLAVVYKDGKHRDRAYSSIIAALMAQIAELEMTVERRKRQEAGAEERALEAEKAVKRLEYEAKMVELERKQESAWELKLMLKAKEGQLRALALSTTRLQALIHGAGLKRPTFATQNERCDALIKETTMEAADIRGRELMAFDEERKELKGALIQRSADTDAQVRELRAATAKAIGNAEAIAADRIRQTLDTLAATQQAATEQLVELKGELEAAGQLIDQMEQKEQRTSHHLLCYRKIAFRLVQYIADKRRLLGAAAETYRPEEIADYARYLGIDNTDEHLTWISEEALHAPLPPHWSSHRDESGDVYFYCGKLDKSSYEHPLDNYYRLLYKELRALYHGETQEYDSVGKNAGEHTNHYLMKGDEPPTDR